MKQLEEELNRPQVLLRVAYQLLQKQQESGWVLNMLEQSTIWDGATCDGYCLLEEIKDLLTDQEVDVEYVGVDENEI